MGTAGGIAIGGANMWALLLDKDPGHSAGTSDLAVDAIDLKLKKAAPVVAAVKLKEAPPAPNVAKPAKRVDKTKKSTKRAAGRSSNLAAASASSVDCGGSKQAAASDEDELTNMWLRRYLSQEGTSKKSEKFVLVARRGGRRRTVAPPTCKPAGAEGFTVTGTNMWALLSDEDTAVAEVEEAPPADDTVDGIAHGVLLAGGANPPKHAKKTKTKKNKKKKKMKGAAKGSKQAAATVNDAEVRINSHDELEEEATSDSDDEEEMTGEVATCGSRCRMVAWRICRAAVAVGLLALYFQLPSAPPVAA